MAAILRAKRKYALPLAVTRLMDILIELLGVDLQTQVSGLAPCVARLVLFLICCAL